MALTTVILAAGKGTRMHSKLPKVLHQLAGKTLLEHVVNTAKSISSTPPIIVYGHEGEVVRHTLAHLDVTWVEQAEQLGTGHALQQALDHIPTDDQVLVLYGDVPLISEQTLKQFIQRTPKSALGLITTQLPNPHGLGRILRSPQNQIIKIVEEKDADAAQRAIREVNSGIYLFPANALHLLLHRLENHNSQKEYYLTDIIPLALQNFIATHSTQPEHYQEILGINDRVQLAELERFYQKQLAEKWMHHGVTLRDPQRFDIRGDVTMGRDITIDVNVILEGRVVIADGCMIGPNTILRNVILGKNVEVKANSVIDGAEIAADCVIGPFARIRPGTELANGAHVGNFVEIKNSIVGQGTKINHLSYVGDSEVGMNVNIGAGTITCNYDGVNKHKTLIGDHVFVGSNTSLVAPIEIGTGATIGAGSTITRAAPAHQLTVCRAQQRSIENWQRPTKKAKES